MNLVGAKRHIATCYERRVRIATLRRALGALVTFDAWLISIVALLALVQPYENEDALPLLLHAPHIFTLLFATVVFYRMPHTNSIIRALLAFTLLACVTDTLAFIWRIVMALRARLLTTKDGAHRHRLECVYLLLAMLFIALDIAIATVGDSLQRYTLPRLRIDSDELECGEQRVIVQTAGGY